MAELSAYRFNSAIVREPARSVIHGLRAKDVGAPDYNAVLVEHQSYIDALRDAGCEVAILPALEQFPDSMFVEDPALVFPEGAIVLRPGARTRQDETIHIRPALEARFETVLSLPDGGFADGGDILTTAELVLIGISSRTDLVGATSLQKCLERIGRKSKIVTTPEDILHFKTACSLMDDDVVLLTPRMAASGIFAKYRTIVTPEGEEAGANAVRINDVVLVGKGYPRTAERLDREGFSIVSIDTTQIGKVDAGLSCMSLRWLDRLRK